MSIPVWRDNVVRPTAAPPSAPPAGANPAPADDLVGVLRKAALYNAWQNEKIARTTTQSLAADRIEQQAAEIDLWERRAVWEFDRAERAVAEIDRLRAERAAARLELESLRTSQWQLDAERYRWLRDADNWTEAGPMPCVATFDSTIYGPALDAAIDAARAEGK